MLNLNTFKEKKKNFYPMAHEPEIHQTVIYCFGRQ